MRRQIAGLHNAAVEGEEVPDGLYLVEVGRAHYRWHAQKPFYLVRFVVLEPKSSAQAVFSGRLYCTPKALWKLAWFLRDFGYDTDLLASDEIEEKSLLGLRGVVKISHATARGISVLNLDGFASIGRWGELSSGVGDLGQHLGAGEVAS
jgi:hypothetical protein